jgi:hypothetical protein
MNDEIKAEFVALADQIRKGFAANDRQFRVLKTRMAKLELELQDVKKVSNSNAIEISGMKVR